MNHKYFIGFLTASFLNLVTGCSITITPMITPQELKPEGETIKEVVLKNDSTLYFHSWNAYYHKPPGVVAGKLKNGREITVRIDNITEIRADGNKIYSPAEIDTTLNVKITEILLTNKTVNAFNENGGRYLSDRKMISGLTNDNQNVSIYLDSIYQLKVERYDGLLSTLATLGIIAGVAGVIAVIILAVELSNANYGM